MVWRSTSYGALYASIATWTANMKRTGARISPYLTPARGRGQFYCVVDLEFDSDVCMHLVDDIGEISGEAMLDRVVKYFYNVNKEDGVSWSMACKSFVT